MEFEIVLKQSIVEAAVFLNITVIREPGRVVLLDSPSLEEIDKVVGNFITLQFSVTAFRRR